MSLFFLQICHELPWFSGIKDEWYLFFDNWNRISVNCFWSIGELHCLSALPIDFEDDRWIMSGLFLYPVYVGRCVYRINFKIYIVGGRVSFTEQYSKAENSNLSNSKLNSKLNLTKMRNLRNLLLMMLLAFVAVFTSCENEDNDPVFEEELAIAAGIVDTTAFAGSDVSAWTEIDEADLPDNVLDYLEQNYAELNVRHAWVDDSGGYVVLLQGKTAVRFDNLGVFVEAIDNAVKKRAKDRPELTEIDTASLSTSITDYIVDNYSDYIILKASTDENGAFYVKLVDGPTLIFDSEGNFTELRESEGHRKRRNNGKRGKYRASDQWTAIDLESLPESVSDYIATNYTDAAVEKAAVAADGNFKVWLDSQVVLLFKEDGSFLSEKTAKGSTEG